MSTEICGIPRQVFEKYGFTDEQVKSFREGYNSYQKLLVSKNTLIIVKCDCGEMRSKTDAYRCRRTKKHKLLCELRQKLQ